MRALDQRIRGWETSQRRSRRSKRSRGNGRCGCRRTTARSSVHITVVALTHGSVGIAGCFPSTGEKATPSRDRRCFAKTSLETSTTRYFVCATCVPHVFQPIGRDSKGNVFSLGILRRHEEGAARDRRDLCRVFRIAAVACVILSSWAAFRNQHVAAAIEIQAALVSAIAIWGSRQRSCSAQQCAAAAQTVGLEFRDAPSKCRTRPSYRGRFDEK